MKAVSKDISDFRDMLNLCTRDGGWIQSTGLYWQGKRSARILDTDMDLEQKEKKEREEEQQKK